MTDQKHWSIATALEQINSCGFECQGGPLTNNAAYRWLIDAAKAGPEFWPGQGVYFEVTAEAAGEKMSRWVHYYIVGCRLDSSSEKRFWVYDLSNDPPRPYHYGTVQHRWVSGELLSLTDKP